MDEAKPRSGLILSLIGSILTIFNGAYVAITKRPIIILTSEVKSLDEIMNSKNFWGRISFGAPGLIGGFWAWFWMIFPILMTILTVIIYSKPRRYRTFGIILSICAALSLPIGGGFYIGSILGFIGGLTYYESPKPFSETFFGKIFKAARVESKFFARICEEPRELNTAALTVIFIGFLSGIGNGLYAYNADLIRKGGTIAFQILYDGHIFWNEIVLFSAISIVGMMMIKWLILSICIYWVGVKLVGLTSTYDKPLRGVAFALVPEVIMFFMPLIFANEPALTFNWPMTLYVISRAWVFICLLIAIRQMFEFSLTRAFGVALLGGAMYWIIYHMFIVPTLNVPGFRINLSMPDSSIALLTIIGFISLIATATGVFSRKQIT
ncbi:hypothetical protein KEJ37_01865 [Candidatus Bathyarchaeota archaeon]|nr:hypothetical protein [Candidatus Bathyarchaeota archaeon]